MYFSVKYFLIDKLFLFFKIFLLFYHPNKKIMTIQCTSFADKERVFNTILDWYQWIDGMIQDIVLNRMLEESIENARKEVWRVMFLASRYKIPLPQNTSSFDLIEIKLQLWLIPKFPWIKKAWCSALDFFKLHYQGTWITQVKLREIDEKLLNAIKYELRELWKSLGDLVPPWINRKI